MYENASNHPGSYSNSFFRNKRNNELTITPRSRTGLTDSHPEKKEKEYESILMYKTRHLVNGLLALTFNDNEDLSPELRAHMIEKLKAIIQCVSNSGTRESIASKNETLEPDLNPIHYSNDSLLKRIIHLIESRIDDETFNTSTICKTIGISRTSLYNKIKQLTGRSVGSFIRSIRLRKAACLLTQGDLNVTQVMYSVGISSPSYFTRFFKKEYGVPPSQFAKKAHKYNISSGFYSHSLF